MKTTDEFSIAACYGSSHATNSYLAFRGKKQRTASHVIEICRRLTERAERQNAWAWKDLSYGIAVFDTDGNLIGTSFGGLVWG